MSFLQIDGSQGEGGGQVLRTSLTLSALSGKAFRIDNIRANRKKPGLLRQHLTAVRAIGEVCSATVEGAELGSRMLTFRPSKPKAGQYRFSVGSAGSACLVCQTVLPALLRAEAPSDIEFQGGTHNPQAPTFDFLEHVYFPLLRRMGVPLKFEFDRAGFFPAGGGAFRVSVTPPPHFRPLELLERDQNFRIEAWALLSGLPKHVGDREIKTIRKQLDIPPRFCQVRYVESHGPGNVVCILIRSKTPELISAFGRKGIRAENVAADAIDQAKRFLSLNLPVGDHLADQMILLLSLAGGRFITGPLSAHASTNIQVTQAFGTKSWLVDTPQEGVTRVTLEL